MATLSSTTRISPKVDPSAFTDVLGMGETGRMGVIGSNPDDGAFGYLAGKDLVFSQNVGVYGESNQQGVMGLTTVPKGTGVYGGGTTAAGGDQIGVRGETVTGVGVLGRSFGAGLAGRFIGDVQVTGELNVDRLQLNGTNLQQRVADLEARVADLEALVGKIIGFMDRTHEQPPALRLNFVPDPSLSLSSSDHFFNAQGFLPNTVLTIRITDDFGFREEKQSPFSTDQNGDLLLNLEQIFSIPRSKNIRIAVTDGRPHPFDWTGFLWATPLGQAGG
jgi:hypothetical protein